jgi:release factor glutamine methyltransferase
LTGVYLYSEDSKLLGSYLSTVDGTGNFLEIGFGNGGNLLSIAKRTRFETIAGTDIMKLDPVREELPINVELFITDKASCFRPEIFDLVVFNPPYVPSSGIVDITTDGGVGGMEVPLQFLASALSVIKQDGKIATVLSSEDSLGDLEQFCKSRHLQFRKVAELALFFETLFVFLISRAGPS